MTQASYKMRQSALLFAALIAEKACYLAATLIISRLLSVANFGKYSFALYAGFAIATFAEFGFQPIVTRDIVASPERRRELFATALLLKVPLALVAAAAIGAMSMFGGFDREQAQLLWIIGLSQVAVTISYIGNSVFRATGRLEIESLASFLRGGLYLAGSAGMLMLGFSLQAIAWSILLANIVSMAITCGLAMTIIRPALPRLLWRDARQLFAQTAPLAAATFATAIFATLSVFVLRLFMDDASVGWYNSAHSLTSHTGFIPEVITAAMLPPMVTALQRNAADRQPLTEMMLVLLGLALPIALGTSLLAPQALSLVFSAKFVPAAPTLALLIWTVPFSFVNVAYVLFLSTRKQQHRWIALVLVGIIITAFGLKLFIPMLGSIGAAMARLIGEVSLCLLGIWNVRKSIDYPRLIGGMARIGVALVGLSAVVLISISAPLIISVALGAATYSVLIVIFGPWPFQFWRTVLSL